MRMADWLRAESACVS